MTKKFISRSVSGTSHGDVGFVPAHSITGEAVQMFYAHTEAIAALRCLRVREVCQVYFVEFYFLEFLFLSGRRRSVSVD